MTWLPLETKMLASAAYDAEKHTLYLRFRKTGDVYLYFDFPQENYRAFVAAESRGQYFLNDIRHDFTCERLTRLTAA
jgi:hypothetical protein